MSPEQRLDEHLAIVGTPLHRLHHAPCRTSAESARMRAAAGFPDATGAKALIVAREVGFTLFVLPGHRRLDGRASRKLIGRFRFATPAEVAHASGGLEIGTIPPFGRPVLPGIDRVIIDARVVESDWVGFNAACLTRSMVMTGSAYGAAALPDTVADISLATEAEE